MSDPNTESAPAPQSNADIVRSVVEQSEAPEPSPESVPVETAAPVESAPPVELTPAQKFLLDKGHKATKEDGRPVWLPYKTIEKMLDDYVGTHRLTWDGEKGVLAKERDQYKKDLDELYTGVKSPDTDAFIKMLAGHDPRYQRYLEKQIAQAQAQQVPTAAEDPEPGPDLDLGDGRLTYSLEGMKKLRAWDQRQQQRAIDERLKPFTEREKAEQDKAARAQWESQRREQHTQLMNEAQTWPYFGKLPADGTLTPFQQDVLKAMQADEKIDLRGAYIKVMATHVAEDDTKKRERLMTEMDERAKLATPTVPRASGPPVRKGPVDNRTIVEETLARLEKQNA